jgi:hypothetical protein
MKPALLFLLLLILTAPAKAQKMEVVYYSGLDKDNTVQFSGISFAPMG